MQYTSRHKLRLSPVLLATALLSACQSFDSTDLVASSAPADLSAPAAAAVAGDLVPRLAEQIGQGKATILLKPDGSVFGSALEASLRTWGYAVTADQDIKDAKVVRLAYALAPADGQILARLSTDTFSIGRIYTSAQTGATPASPISIMRRG
jgi:hypothetical protein